MDEYILNMQEENFSNADLSEDTELNCDQLRAILTTVISSVATFLFLLMSTRRTSTQVTNPERNIERHAYLSRLYLGSDSDCVNMVRMKRRPFFELCTLLRSRRLLVDTINIHIEEQVAMFLHTVGHSIRNRVVRFNFQRSGETVSRYFNAVLYAIGQLRNEFIKPPSLQTPSKIRENYRFMPFFKDCVGAIDGTHIKARVPKEYVISFRGRKPYPTQNVLAAVDFDLRFTYVLAGWEGSAHDATVLKDALARPDGLKIDEGKYYLADGGYSTKRGFISPYRATRYHLKEFNGIRPSNYKELFNLRHSSLRTTVERAFGSLKNRFGILKCDPYFPLNSQVDIVLACCILHNWIVTEGGDDLIISETDWAHMQRSRRCIGEILDDSNEWIEKRDIIANAMWTQMSDSGY